MLSGSLATFGVLDVLRLLSASGVTGDLRLDRDGAHDASIRLSGGRILDARLDGRPAGPDQGRIEDTLVHLATWRTGEFAFEGPSEPSALTEAAEASLGYELDELSPAVLDRLGALDPLWSLAAREQPVVLKLAPDPPPGLSNIQLSLEEWGLLTNLNGGRTIEEVALRVDLNPTVALERLGRLIQTGLVDVISPPPPPEPEIMPAPRPRPFSIAVLCTGNRARSAFVAGLITDATRDLPVEVVSFGVDAPTSLPPLPKALTAAHELGVDISGCLSSRLARGSLRDTDLVIGFESKHVAEATTRGGASAAKTFTLGQLISILRAAQPPSADTETWHPHEVVAWANRNRMVLGERAQGFDVADPAGASAAVFRSTFTTVKALVDELLGLLFGVQSLPRAVSR
jgi:protein-tyrosine-phosphatase